MMRDRALADVTLACVDTVNHALALRALAASMERLAFGRVVLLTDRLPKDVQRPPSIDVVGIDPLRSRDDYSRFVLKHLVEHVLTPHVLLVQWDGYVVNADAWESAFTDVDYLGARWFWHTDGHDVGNGGFSLRSRRLLDALQDPRIDLVEAEDTTIGRTFRKLLEREHGIRFGSAALADRFAFEATYPVGKPFGFHGLYNFCRVVPPAELAALAPAFSDAIVRSPQLAQLLRNCVALGQWSPAIAVARRVLDLVPDNAEARLLLDRSEAALARGEGVGRNDPCPCGSGKRFKHCHGDVTKRSAVATSGGEAPDAIVARALQAHQRGDLEAASRDYEAALALSPDHPHALHYLGVIAYQQRRAAEALPMLERAVAQVPHEPEFHNNLGLVLAAVDRDEEAVGAFRKSLALRPDHAGAWNNLGLALHARNDLAGAMDAFRRSMSFDPGAVQTRWNLALALLHDGQFSEGWDAYEARLRIPAFAPASMPSTPLWDGSDAAGRTILLVAEQGLGDAIHFVRFATDVARRGARVVVQAPPPLLALFRRVEGVADVAPLGEAAPAHDAWLPLLSLPRVLHIDASSIPSRVPYLRADETLSAAVASELASYAASLRVGVAWAGSRNNTNDRRRSIALREFVTCVAGIEGVTVFSLQKGDDEDDGGRAPGAERLVRLRWREDFDGIAALMQALDVIVTVDTSIAHLAGALARPVLILLPFASDWRWRTNRSDSDWYPTATLYRQRVPGDWTGPLSAVRQALLARTRG